MLQTGVMTLHPNKKSDIKFIRNVAAPKRSPSFKSQSSTHINYHCPPIAASPLSLLLCLTLPDKAHENLLFSYNEHTKVHELIQFVKSRIGMEHGYFKSGNILIDYFLTFHDRFIGELNLSKLQLSAHHIQVCDEITLRNVEVLKCIGSGGFSKVVLGRVFGMLMAIKVIDKQFVFKTAKQSIVQNQKLILQLCEGHPFITQLYFSFQTNKYIILGLEYCNGGELFNLLRKVKKMKEEEAKFYFIQTLLAIEHLHSKGILYRDLKPQNIIIDADGHIRLADFGLSKIVNRSPTYSFCGSAEYMSPQMLLKKGHSYQVDYYCLGALLYELVTGLPPFYSHNQPQLFNNILNSELTFPAHATLSDKLKLFLKKVLQKQPENRFQSIFQILNDPWVSQNFNKELFMTKKVKPPHSTNIFTYNFDDSEFGCHEQVMLKLLQNEKQSLQQAQRVYNNFYYESQVIIELRNKVKLNKKEGSFAKNKIFSKNEIYVPSRNTSIHIRPPFQADSPRKVEQNNSILNRPSGPALLPTSTSKKHQIRSNDNIRATVSPYSYQSRDKLLSPSNIYTNKPRFSPSNIIKKQKLSHHVYSVHEKSLDMKLNTSGSQRNISYQRPKSKDKSSSVDRRFMEKKEQLNYYNKNYLTELNNKYAQPKVKKSYRHGDRINFHYGTLNR